MSAATPWTAAAGRRFCGGRSSLRAVRSKCGRSHSPSHQNVPMPIPSPARASRRIDTTPPRSSFSQLQIPSACLQIAICRLRGQFSSLHLPFSSLHLPFSSPRLPFTSPRLPFTSLQVPFCSLHLTSRRLRVQISPLHPALSRLRVPLTSFRLVTTSLRVRISSPHLITTSPRATVCPPYCPDCTFASPKHPVGRHFCIEHRAIGRQMSASPEGSWKLAGGRAQPRHTRRSENHRIIGRKLMRPGTAAGMERRASSPATKSNREAPILPPTRTPKKQESGVQSCPADKAEAAKKDGAPCACSRVS